MLKADRLVAVSEKRAQDTGVSWVGLYESRQLKAYMMGRAALVVVKPVLVRAGGTGRRRGSVTGAGDHKRGRC